ncbi:hypothetical protein [Methylomonas koyamae]|uniref:Uncharacterized protein n=1 Tax=Methylomonas koyamae TaxID=702114 RepID=A0AA91D9P3_9GAMM|nr:hypothetical protein [Methylomonas koyamae]OAI22154.1 hypothetical protein A1356_01785 [Methylomonas koyamae]
MDLVTTRSLVIWDAARNADSIIIFKRMARRWWIHAAQHSENEHVKAVQKIFFGAIADGVSKDNAEKMAFFRPVGKCKPLLEMKVMFTFHELKSEYPLESDIALFHRVYRKLRKDGVQSWMNVKKIYQGAKGRYVF